MTQGNRCSGISVTLVPVLVTIAAGLGKERLA